MEPTEEPRKIGRRRSSDSRGTSHMASHRSHHPRKAVSETSRHNSAVTSTNRSRLWSYPSRATISDTMTSTGCEPSNGDVSSEVRGALARLDLDKPALHVWRLQARHLISLKSDNHGFFHEGDCYLVLRVCQDRSMSLHSWIGQNTTQLDTKTVEKLCKDMDCMVHWASVLSREVQGHESASFLRNFPDGIVYLEGRAKTTLARAVKYSKRLYVIKNRQFARAVCTEPRQEELDSKGAALLDGFPRMYLWLGAQCDSVSCVKAIELARKIRESQRKGKASIVVVEETNGLQNAALMKKLQCGDKEEKEVTSKTSQVSAETDSTSVINLHRVSGDSVLYDMPFAATAPLPQCFLLSTDSYLLDQGQGLPVFVWMGAKASNTQVSEAVSRGQSFAAYRGYPSWLSVCRVLEGYEPTTFTRAFLDWKERAAVRTQLSWSYNVGTIGRALFSRSAPRTVAKVAPLLDSDLTLDLDGETETFRVDGDSLEASCEQPGVFVNSDCYVIWHRPDLHSLTHLYPPNILFYWLGSKSDASTQSICLRLCLTMACALEHALVIRVLDDKEPQSLLSIFHNSMVVYDQDVLSAGSDVTLYCVRECAQGSMRVQQVPAMSSYLNSSAAFILLTPSQCVLWFGKLTGGAEREFSKTMLGFLDSRRMYSFHLVTEGSEPDNFWEELGPKMPYEEHFDQHTQHRRTPRLSLCSCSEKEIIFLEIIQFSQTDLSESDIFILDVFDQLFVWCGSSVAEESRKEMLPRFFKEYVSHDPAGRKESEVQLWIVPQDSEPEVFRRYFAFWDPNLYGGKQAYAWARKGLRQENASIDLTEQIVDRTYRNVARHTYRALLKTELPAGVLADHREHHLSNKQFLQAVKMTREEFYRLPEWKQAQVLKSARLAHFLPVKLHTVFPSSSH